MILGAFIKQHLSFVPLLCTVSYRSAGPQSVLPGRCLLPPALIQHDALGTGWLFKRSINDITECRLLMFPVLIAHLVNTSSAKTNKSSSQKLSPESVRCLTAAATNNSSLQSVRIFSRIQRSHP